MQAHEQWRLIYRARRYMDHLAPEHLEQRAADVFHNPLTITSDGKLGVLPVVESRPWLILWTHVLEEFFLRHGPPPAGFNGFVHRSQIPDPRSPLCGQAAWVTEHTRWVHDRYLAKYGKRSHLEQVLHEGKIRLLPASGYADPSLNAAVRDTELELPLQPPPEELTIDVLDAVSHQTKGRVRPRDNVVTARSTTDYYPYCMSYRLSARLFIDFQADACLVITNADTFLERLLLGFARRFPDWNGYVETIRYYDPINTRITDLYLYISKHFRYWYQGEVRAFWLPPTPIEKLEPISLNLGSLEDCCRLVSLSDCPD